MPNWRYIETPHPADLDPDDPDRWQAWSIEIAARHAHCSTNALRNWMTAGRLKEGEHWKPGNVRGVYRFDMHMLYHLARLGKQGRRKFWGEPYPKPAYERAEDLRKNGWPPGHWETLSYRQLGILFDISLTTARRWVVDGVLESEEDIYEEHQSGSHFYNLDALADFVARSRASNSRLGQPHKGDARTGLTSRQRRKREFEAARKEIEGDYIPPELRQDRSDIDMIEIQERSEKALGKLFGNQRIQYRPLESRRLRKERALAEQHSGDM
jgi:hypothetical protein